MPHRIFNLSEVAEYLHLSRPDVEVLVRRNEVPFERKGAKLIFRRTDIDAWASERILKTKDQKLSEFHRKSLILLQGSMIRVVWRTLSPPT